MISTPGCVTLTRYPRRRLCFTASTNFLGNKSHETSTPMNASAYLKGQGWRGSGFSLDQTNRGLSKPLLVSHRTDQSGLGTKKNDFSEQWWMNNFDKSLKAFGGGGDTVRDLNGP